MKKIVTAIVVSVVALTSSAALASNAGQMHPKQLHWPFDGMFGTVDRQAAQRGFQVYKEVCSACHSLNRVAIRNLSSLGFSEAEIKEIAAGYTVQDGPNDDGDMFDRPGRPSDRFPKPFPNEKAARAANGGAYPPDLDLIVKARKDGANYVYSLLTGYQEAPAEVHVGEGLHYNPYFPNGQLRMPQPLSDGQVTYQDGTSSTLDQMSRDVVVFLQWAAEPEMEARKLMGLRVLIFVSLMTVLLYIAKRIIWRKVH